jgi:hypothetical protein
VLVLCERGNLRLVSEHLQLLLLLLPQLGLSLQVDAHGLGYQVVCVRTLEVLQLDLKGRLSQSLGFLTDVWLEKDCLRLVT